MPIAVAHDEEAGIIGHLSPFVEIKRNRIRALKSCQPRRKYRRENPESTEGAIDDLAALSALCREKGLWFHVYGAFGALGSL